MIRNVPFTKGRDFIDKQKSLISDATNSATKGVKNIHKRETSPRFMPDKSKARNAIINDNKKISIFRPLVFSFPIVFSICLIVV